eukprot:SAG31_NODE_251_length_19069_cov_5.843226_2_plen_148_part_00
MMQLLLDARPDLDAIDETGRTPLHFAAEAEQLREAMLLIAAGARVDVKDVYGKLALELASAEVRGVLDRQATTGTDDITAAPDIDVSFFEWVARHGLQQVRLQSNSSLAQATSIKNHSVRILLLKMDAVFCDLHQARGGTGVASSLR